MRIKIFIFFLLFSLNLNAGNVIKSKAQSIIDNIMKEEPYKSASVGILAVNFRGDTLASFNGNMKLIPASNTKLITTGLALSTLGSGFKFETKIGYSGEIEDGVLKGDLYIVGGGDPTIGTKDSIAIATDSLFAIWKSFLDKVGISRIEGNIIGDGRFFNGGIEEQSWQQEDLGSYYGAGGNGLSFNRNIKVMYVESGNEVGDELYFSDSFPATPWMTYIYNCSTGTRGSGDRLYMFNTELYPAAEIRGTFGADSKRKRLDFSNKFGAYTCAYYFYTYLNDNKLIIKGSYGDINMSGNLRFDLRNSGKTTSAIVQDSLKIIGSTFSAPLKEIARITNHRSDNFYAEALYRRLGREIEGSADYEVCRKAEYSALAALGVDTSYGIQLVDGSGLSKKDYLAPDFICRFLTAMLGSDKVEDYLGTITNVSEGSRLSGYENSIRERIYWKSGSMDGVRCYSGYIAPSNGIKEDTIIFSIMINNCISPGWKMNLTIDSIVGSLAKEN